MIYEGLFENWKDVGEQFETELPLDVLPLFAAYDQEGYEGSAVVLYVHNNELKFVYGGHCSCYGLEGQWEPETIEWECAEEFLEKTYYLDRYKEYVIPVVRELVLSEDREMEIGELITLCKLKYGI